MNRPLYHIVRALVPLLLLLGIPEQGSAQPTVRVVRVIVDSGEGDYGVIIRETDDSIVIRNELGIDIGYRRSDIRSIHVYRYRGKYLAEQYWSAGLTWGLPGLPNLVVARNIAHEWQFRTLFGYLGDRFLAEFGGLYRIADTGPLAHSILFGFGHSSIETTELRGGVAELFDREWTYFQIAYNLNVAGIDLTGGFSAGQGGYENPRYLFQIGYVHAFDD